MQFSSKLSRIQDKLGTEEEPPSKSPNPLSNRQFNSKRQRDGFTLAEIAVALGIFSFALVSMLGLLSVGMKNARRANVQTAATNLMAGISADINASTKSVSGDTETYSSPKLKIVTKIKAGTVIETSSTTANPIILTESGAFLDLAKVSLLEKNYLVQLILPSAGTRAIRLRIEWPGQRPPNTNPEGFLETLVPLPF